MMVSKMIGSGSDPNTPAPVQIDGRVVRLTPLEAAVVSRDVATVALLTRMGARLDAATYVRLTCLARDVGADDIVDFLEKGHATGPSPGGCADVSLPAR